MNSLFRKLSWFRRRRRKEEELEEEFRSYLDEETEQLQAQGMSPEEAYRAARLELGNVTLLREDTRTEWSWRMLEFLLRDVLSAVRLLARDIRVNAVIVSMIALGMAANTTMFSMVNGVLLNLPIPDPERLFLISETYGPDLRESPVSVATFREWQNSSTSFQSLGAYLDRQFTLLEGEHRERISGALVTTSYFATMGIKPQLGRIITPEHDNARRWDIVVISSQLWARRFGSDPNIVGRTINIDSRQRSVVGVLDFPLEGTDAWIPIAFDAADRDNRDKRNLLVYGRLAPRSSSEQALAELKHIARRLETTSPGKNAGWSVALIPFVEGRDAIAYVLLLLWGVAGLLLLIVCANIANLQLARSISRRREVAVRMAIGATRFQVIRQLLAESILLAFVGGATGLLLTYWGARILNALGSDVLPIAVRMEPILLLFTALLSVVAGMVFGLAPALELSKSSLSEHLKDGSRNASASPTHQRLRSSLVAAEVAVSLMLLICASLMFRSFVKVSSVNLGFNATNVLAAEVALPERKYATVDQARRFVDNALQQLSSLSGVTTAGASDVLPFSADSSHGVVVEGKPAEETNGFPQVSYSAISPQYFAALEIPLKHGREFRTGDNVGSPPVAIVNEAFATRFFPNESAIGKRIRVTAESETWREIVGIAGDVKLYGPAVSPPAQVYGPLEQTPFSSVTLLVKATGNPVSLARSIERRIQNGDEDPPVAVRTLQEIVEESFLPVKIIMRFLNVFGGAALLIAATGLYGVVSYSVSQRSREIGLRIALGADRRGVLATVMRQGMVPAAIGIILGIAGAAALVRLLQPLLFQTSGTDVVTYVAISILSTSVALLACYLPARRALRVDPMVVLRHE